MAKLKPVDCYYVDAGLADPSFPAHVKLAWNDVEGRQHVILLDLPEHTIVEIGNLPDLAPLQMLVLQAPIREDKVGAWISTHSEELRKYQGEYIAIHPITGIVARNRNFRAVHNYLDGLGLLNVVCLIYVPVM